MVSKQASVMTWWNSDADGLFLAAPRRTGKSTFLKGDLRPALEAMGAEVIYLDFWTNLRHDPAEMPSAPTVPLRSRRLVT